MDSVALGTALDEASMAVLVAHGARRDGARTGRSVSPGRSELVIDRPGIFGDRVARRIQFDHAQ
jgi:hypothetical protein